jgi:mono/diheme cytochrome c family protein
MVAIEFSTLKPTTATGTTPTPTPPVTATPTPTPIGPITYTQLTANGGIIRTNCAGCHSGATPAAALNLLDYTSAKNAAQNIKSRVNNSTNPMPPTGLLQQNLRDQISAWVDQGAPQ